MSRLKTPLFFICFFFCASLMAEDLGLPKFNKRTVHTFQGTVISVQKFSLVTRPVPYIQFILQTEEGEYTVELGPQWVLEINGLLIIPQEKITVVGSLVEIRNKKVVIASQITKGENTVRLRSEEGTPLWGGQRALNSCTNP